MAVSKTRFYSEVRSRVRKINNQEKINIEFSSAAIEAFAKQHNINLNNPELSEVEACVESLRSVDSLAVVEGDISVPAPVEIQQEIQPEHQQSEQVTSLAAMSPEQKENAVIQQSRDMGIALAKADVKLIVESLNNERNANQSFFKMVEKAITTYLAKQKEEFNLMAADTLKNVQEACQQSKQDASTTLRNTVESAKQEVLSLAGDWKSQRDLLESEIEGLLAFQPIGQSTSAEIC